ncbi:MAG TPA: protein kinase, partial [Gemmatimonadales bacterium]|nr:protein kinase [Gemmatimonadales bacterium]
MTPYKPQETFGKNLRHGLVESEALIASLERVRRAHAGVKKNVVPSITTFYSHEDSPIRSTALLFTAALLAERGQRVLLVDWNLESPGIARDAQGAASTPGLVELLRSFTEPQKLSWRDCVFPVRSFLGSTELHVLSAGRDDVDYEARFRGLNVAQLVERHDLGRRLEAIRAEWLGAYDAILIDSPPGTGLLSGLCVIHLADRVVLLLAPDKKSISVAKSILRRATAQQMRLPLDRKRLIAIPVLAVETATALDASWRELAAQELGEFLADWLPRSARPVDAIPSLAVGANPSSSDFLSDYNRLARLLDGDMTELAQTNPGGVRPFPLQRSSRYRPLKWIKDGAMGSVWRAYNCNLGIEVALKFVRGGDYERTKAILAEGRNMARVDHDRVVKVLEVGEAEGQAFIAMQYVDGETLGQKAPHLTIEQKVLLLRDVAFGVQAVHEAGLIHRDIKPSSILVKDSSEGLKPYLMGFGVARKEKVAANETRELIGTPEYMSPEQVRGYVASLDRRADVYGLGATLYALLVGRPPFQDEDELRLLHRVLREKPVSPRER